MAGRRGMDEWYMTLNGVVHVDGPGVEVMMRKGRWRGHPITRREKGNRWGV